MNDGWVKLHRRLLDNRVLKHDHNAMVLFIALLLLVRHKDGTYDAGRFQLASIVGMNPSTMYKTLKRLEKAKMVTLRSNTRYTLIHICNWTNYQGSGNTSSNNTVTTRSQHGNTKQERRIKKEEIATGIFFDNKELEIAFSDFTEMRNRIKKPMTNKAKQLIINKLNALYPDRPNMQIKCLNQSVENCWQSVFAVKQDASTINITRNDRPPRQQISDEERLRGQEKLAKIKADFLKSRSVA